MARRTYRRLPVEDRRRQLLERATELFSERAYDELSMADVARAAGISKPLLYHYFPSKRRLFEATLAHAAEDLAARTEPDPNKPPLEQLEGSVDAFLGWIEENPAAYTRLMRGQGVPEVRVLIDDVRERTGRRILAAVAPGGSPAARTAVHGWLWFMDGAILDWLEHRDLGRDELRGLLVGTLVGALGAAGETAAGAGGVATAPAT